MLHATEAYEANRPTVSSGGLMKVTLKFRFCVYYIMGVMAMGLYNPAAFMTMVGTLRPGAFWSKDVLAWVLSDPGTLRLRYVLVWNFLTPPHLIARPGFKRYNNSEGLTSTIWSHHSGLHPIILVHYLIWRTTGDTPPMNFFPASISNFTKIHNDREVLPF